MQRQVPVKERHQLQRWRTLFIIGSAIFYPCVHWPSPL
ncbi:hypothetical protein B4114_2717 [Geobacillus stearothermophilus]|uniref:Uncharacterized protein n=1 Tax=Geobacillus stearothermophilus TaxID=1422 RepID=A0A150NE47_GEOSE|nr:hypothetical protein B4114_2717 [Geobacillus stearothermophilus]